MKYQLIWRKTANPFQNKLKLYYNQTFIILRYLYIIYINLTKNTYLNNLHFDCTINSSNIKVLI